MHGGLSTLADYKKRPGGNTLFHNFKERLERDLADSVSVSPAPAGPNTLPLSPSRPALHAGRHPTTF